jgi:ribose transport system substrate-binding protein
LAAARAAGRTDLIIINQDLGENVAIEMAKGGMVKGMGSQRPREAGIAEARLAAYALLGKESPPYVALPAAPITKENLLDMWKEIYGAEATDKIKSSFK